MRQFDTVEIKHSNFNHRGFVTLGGDLDSFKLHLIEKYKMPMIPSFLAAATYTAIKVGGYYCFAKVMNKRLKHSFPPLRFGLIKVVCGFVGGSFFFDCPKHSTNRNAPLGN